MNITNPKQIIVVRKDLNMRKGKIAAQAAHASMKVLLDAMRVEEDFAFKYCSLSIRKDEPLDAWLTGSFTKVVVSVDSLEELNEIYNNAIANGIRSAIIVDSGATEFHGISTPTCVAVGPDYPEKIDKITGHLKLL